MKALKEALAKKKEGIEIKIILADGDAQKGVKMPDIEIEQEEKEDEEEGEKKSVLDEDMGLNLPMQMKKAKKGQ
jgi:hypothetical protein